jgi:hypothetical protein
MSDEPRYEIRNGVCTGCGATCRDEGCWNGKRYDPGCPYAAEAEAEAAITHDNVLTAASDYTESVGELRARLTAAAADELRRGGGVKR